jgi:hypothetical protein
MIFDKVAKLGVTMAMLGLVVLTSCSENDNGMASSYSETQTGKPVIRSGMPIAELDTTYLRKVVNEGHGCGSLAKSAVNVESEGVAEVDSAETEVVQYFRISCSAHDDIYLYIKTRGQVVDSEGQPVVGAVIYENYCSFDDERCQHVTDKDGYFYIDSVHFLTYLQMDDPKGKYLPDYELIQLRALSADFSLGANVFMEFSKATVAVVDDDPVADLGKIVVEPVYTAKFYLDSLFATEVDSTLEYDERDNERWNETMTKNIRKDGDGICVALNEVVVPSGVRFVPSLFYPCYKVTEEDYKNGYVIFFGLPEGNYRIDINGFGNRHVPDFIITGDGSVK